MEAGDFTEVSSIALVASDQPAWIMTARQCSHISRPRRESDRPANGRAARSLRAPPPSHSWWVWREQTARSSRSPLRLRKLESVAERDRMPSQTRVEASA